MMRVKDVTIERADNGYILRQGDELLETYPTLEALMQKLLMIYEGLSFAFVGAKFGNVVIYRHDHGQEFKVNDGTSAVDKTC